MKTRTSIATFVILLSFLFFGACKKKDDIKKENAPEEINQIELTFINVADETIKVQVIASDPDGEGAKKITQEGASSALLAPNTTYMLEIKFKNTLLRENEEGYDTTKEIEEEKDEHMIFFSWTSDMFSDPTGNGNISSRSGKVNYEDEDDNKLPVGLTTKWTTRRTALESGKFRVILKHQPGLKTSTSGSDVGDTDADFEFTISVK